jgi:two-component system, LytTR family, response regulator
MIRTVVADDEPLAAAALAHELQRLGCDVVAVTGTGRSTVEACVAHRPQLCVADVSMPDGDGLAMARALRVAAPTVRVVFVTAHPQYAVDAFAAEVVDFVPKPIRRARLADAIARATRVIRGDEEPRLAVGERGAVQLLGLRDIDWIQADGPMLWIHTSLRAWPLRERMQQLEERLAGHGFLRVHRSALVREGTIVSFESGGDGDAYVVLHSGARVRVARDRIAEVRIRLRGLETPHEP